ncbi:MAG: hypothetical protein LQ345_005943 [Seirophora villosa]|nr:MAG: hypothetical protein LQ345_005943 [Seirophora villosa]
MSQSEEAASPSKEAQAFKTRLEDFLRPLASISHLSAPLQALEAKYQEAHNIFFFPSSSPPPSDNYRLQCLDILSDIYPSSIFGVPGAEVFEEISLKARCCLLKAMFHYNRHLPSDLGHYELSAKYVAANLEIPRMLPFGKAARENQAKGLREVEMLCGEMQRRIKAEVPRERWRVTTGMQEDGRPYEWFERMGDEWLKVTDKVEGVQDGK